MKILIAYLIFVIFDMLYKNAVICIYVIYENTFNSTNEHDKEIYKAIVIAENSF